MKDLLYKEFSLARHQTTFLFLLFALMLLIPSYPYYVAFIYTCLSIFFIFLSGRENRDVFYTVLLPVRKKDIVRARCAMIVLVELMQILVSVPFAVLGAKINPNPTGNMAGIEANVAFFGFVFIMYAIFNVLFIPTFYKTAYSAGRALAFGGIAMGLYIVVIEVLVQVIPAWNAALDTLDPALQLRQLPILLGGMLLYAGSMLLAIKMAEKRFERVDL